MYKQQFVAVAAVRVSVHVLIPSIPALSRSCGRDGPQRQHVQRLRSLRRQRQRGDAVPLPSCAAVPC